MAKLYTKKGDEGKTSLATGHPIKKSNLRLEAYGSLDELNSVLGIIRSLVSGLEGAWALDLHHQLARVQSDLFILGSRLACDDKSFLMKLPQLPEDRIRFLENAIDAASSECTPLKNFILPGGHLIASHTHLARCVCRRAERETVRLDELEEVERVTLIYLNRLSDYFFALARLINVRLGVADEIWKPES